MRWMSSDLVSRFCCTTVSSPPSSSATTNFVDGPEVGRRADRARLALPRLEREQADLLRADGERPPVPLEDVGRADEPRDERRRRMLVHLRRRADLLDPPVVEDGDPIAHRERLFLVVRDVDERHPELLLDLLELDLQLLAELQVERAERLVEEQRPRRVHDRARERDALPLAAGQLAGLALAVPLEPDAGERLARLRAALRLRDLPHAQAVLHVLLHRHVREQRVVLEDGVDRPVERRATGDVRPAELDPALVGPLEAGDHPQRRRLARAGRAEHREELAARDVEVDPVDGRDVPVPLPHADDADVDVGRGC